MSSLKKALLIILGLLLFYPVHSWADTKDFIGEFDVTGDAQTEKIYTQLVSRGKSEIKKIIILKNGKNIFPEQFPRLEPFIARNGMIMFVTFGSYGGYDIGKYDNIPGMQILIFQRGYSYKIDGKESSCWQKDISNLNEGKLIKRVFVNGHLFEYDKNRNEFVYYRDDYVEYLSNDIPQNDRIIKMFKSKTKFAQAFEKASLILNLMKEKRLQEAKKLCLKVPNIDFYLNSIGKGKMDVSEYNLKTWKTVVNEYGYSFNDSITPPKPYCENQFFIQINRDLEIENFAIH